MFSSPQKSPQKTTPGQHLVECVKVKICTNNRVAKSLYDKVINIDVKSIFLTKPLAKVKNFFPLSKISFIFKFSLL